MEGKLQQVKSLFSCSSVNDLRVIDFEPTSKIRSSVVLTSKDIYEQFLAKKLHRNVLPEPFFPSKIAEPGVRKWSPCSFSKIGKIGVSRRKKRRFFLVRPG